MMAGAMSASDSLLSTWKILSNYLLMKEWLDLVLERLVSSGD